MTQPCPNCAEQVASVALLALHLHELHGAPATRKAKALIVARTKPLSNDLPSTPALARQAERRTRPKPSRSIKTVPGGRSTTRFR